jgi:hypothetical protein
MVGLQSALLAVLHGTGCVASTRGGESAPHTIKQTLYPSTTDMTTSCMSSKICACPVSGPYLVLGCPYIFHTHDQQFIPPSTSV